MKGGAWRRFEIRATFGKLRPWQRLGAKVGALFVGVTALAVGVAVVGNIGSEQRAKYAAVGSVVNLAARLEDAAAAGQILLSSETYERIREAADVGPALRLELKGFGGPCAAHELRGLSGHS